MIPLMEREKDPELQAHLARAAYMGLLRLCDSAVPEAEISVDAIGAMLRLIGQACDLADAGPLDRPPPRN